MHKKTFSHWWENH